MEKPISIPISSPEVVLSFNCSFKVSIEAVPNKQPNTIFKTLKTIFINH